MTSALSPADYFVDLLFRPRSSADVAGGSNASTTETMGAAAAPMQPLSPEMRAEVTRIVVRATAQGRLDPGDPGLPGAGLRGLLMAGRDALTSKLRE